ncbi:MAG: hypothetical protein ABR955_13025 [Verrucomicrobiota bacterium]
MITKPTTLILGAGASKPFGFPTGNEIKERVLSLNNSDPLFGSYHRTNVTAYAPQRSPGKKQTETVCR